MRRNFVCLCLELLESRHLLSISATPIFNEEFNLPAGSLPSTGTWKYDVGWDPNAAVHYIDDASVMSVVNDPTATDGKALAINILRGPDDTHGHPTFLSARINTSVDPVAGSLQYGRVEARIKMPGGPDGQGNGLWPAFWMLGANFPEVGWPNCGEIDIMENRGTTPGTIQGSLHSGAFYGPRMDPTSFFNLPPGQAFYGAYHTFAADWSPGSIRFSVDSQVYSTFLKSSYAPGVWNFDNHGFFAILNIADGGAFGGPLGPNSTFPQTMYVDYVRAYSLTGIDTPANLTARAVTMNQVNLGWQDPANDATGFLLQRSTTPDFATVMAFNLAPGTMTYQDTSAAPGTIYYYRLQASATDGATTYQSDFTDAAVTTTWVDQDVNAAGGSGAFSGGTFTLVGMGGGIGGASDQFNFLSGPVTGDSLLFGRLTALTNTGSSARGGLMVRNSPSPDSAFAAILEAPGGGLNFQWRGADGGVASSAGVTGVNVPVWLQLVRTGNSFTGLYSTDDVTWRLVGAPQTVALGATALDGLAVTSGSPSVAATATLTNVSVGPYVGAAAVALNCGGPARGEFAADAYYSTTGTQTSSTNAAIDTTGVPHPASQSVYDSNRYGNHFTYTIPNLTPGAGYDVEMHFAENYWTSAGQRMFNIGINGTNVLSGFDIYASAGGAHMAVQEDFLAVADANGILALDFTTSKDNAQINGLRIIPLMTTVPGNLSATAVSSSEIDLSWAAPSSQGVIGYNLYRGASPGGESANPLNATPVTATAYQDTTVSPLTTYYYVVRAVYAAGTSDPSNEASATTPDAAGADLALFHPAFASSVENSSFPASNAVDGNSATRWSSQFSDPQWIYVDLGAVYNITEVKLNWEHAAGKDYQIQVSFDVANWTTIATITGNTTSGLHDYAGLSGTGQYVRMYGTARTSPYGYSLFDFNVYGNAAPSAPSSRSGGTASAGSTEPGGNPPSALDGMVFSPESVVRGSWQFVPDYPRFSEYGLRTTDYGLLVSEDGTDWAAQPPVAAGTGSEPIIDVALDGRVTARYVRIVQTGTPSSWWSIAELNLYV
jgi:beta-glucanase (GH16 family)